MKSDGTIYSKNPFKVLSDVIKNEGVKSLYKGCSSLVMVRFPFPSLLSHSNPSQGSVAKDAIRFLTFDRIRSAFTDPTTGQLSAGRSLAAGMAAGVVASTFAVTPTERIKTALIDDARSSGARRFHGPLPATTSLLAAGGLRELYRGYATTTLKQMGTSGVRLGCYNVLKDWETGHGVVQTTPGNFANGAVAGTVTTYATQPFDVVKTRAQSAEGAKTADAFRSVLADYGVKGLWKGSVMRLGRTLPAGGILFTSYEGVSALLKTVLPQYK